MDKVTLIQVVPMPANKMLVDKYGCECECDIIAYFHSSYDNKLHELPLAFGELADYSSVDDVENWNDQFTWCEENYRIVDRDEID